jgi:hypothetical protein
MILEALNYLATWPLTTAAHRRFIGKSVSLWARAQRCARAWQPHEAASQQVVMAAISDLRMRRSVVVLGSGLARDVPLDALAKAFDTVILVDLVHLASLRLRIAGKRLRNVRLIERDLSGYDGLKADQGKGDAPEPLAFLRQVPYLDLVISANLLSQISVAAARRLAMEAPGAMPADALERIIRAHLDGLSGLPCRALLITDTRYRVIDRAGHVHEEHDLMAGIALAPPAAQWDWSVVPFGEESPDYQVVHRVIAHS